MKQEFLHVSLKHNLEGRVLRQVSRVWPCLVVLPSRRVGLRSIKLESGIFGMPVLCHAGKEGRTSGLIYEGHKAVVVTMRVRAWRVEGFCSRRMSCG